MERLTKKQREILKYLKRFHNGIPYSEFTEIFNYAGINIEIDILQENGLIGFYNTNGKIYTHKGIDYPNSFFLKITPKGREKFRETFITRIYDTAYNNPWAVMAIIISVISLIVTIYTSVHTNQRTESLSIDLNEVKGKLAQYDTLVVKNFTSTSNTISFLCPNGTVPSEEKVNESGVYFLCAPK